jgi:hypothetical protein
MDYAESCKEGMLPPSVDGVLTVEIDGVGKVY